MNESASRGDTSGRPQPAAPPAEVLTTGEAAALCGVSPETIRRWIRTKGLPAFNTELGLRIRIRRADLVDFAREHNILVRDLTPPSRSF